MKPLSSRLMFCEPFFKKTFKEYVKEKDLILVGDKSYNDYKFFQDLSLDDAKAFLSFINTFDSEIRSKNKSSGETPHLERKAFFESHKVYHFHMVTEKDYENTHNIHEKEVKPKDENGNFRTIETEFLKNCHVSNLYLNYQRKEVNGEMLYKVLFICSHPKRDTNEWNELKENMEILKK